MLGTSCGPRAAEEASRTPEWYAALERNRTGTKRRSEMTKKEYYDLLVKTSLEGGFPAIDDGGNCLYRTSDGKACGIGIIMPDAFYNRLTRTQKTFAVDQIVNERSLPSWVPEDCDVKILLEVQGVHDSLRDKWSHAKFVRRLKIAFGFSTH